MLWGKKVLGISAAVIVALAAGHAAETLKAPVDQAAFSLDSLRVKPAKHPAPAVEAGPVPPSASLSVPDKPGLDDVIGITSIAASAPESSDDPCRPALGLAALPGGMIAMTLAAPCNASQRVVVRHSGLSFTGKTSATGMLAQVFPAFREDAQVAVYLEGSRFILGRTEVPDVSEFTRVAVSWDASTELEMRVTKGDKLMVGSPNSVMGDTEQVIVLGTTDVSAPVQTSIYSVAGPDLGTAKITAELRITPATCGRTLRLATLVLNHGAAVENEHQVSVPLCGTSGDILVLKNLVPALKLATPK